MANRPPRLAVLGGAPTWRPKSHRRWEIRHFLADRHGGNGELKRLLDALRSGSVDRLVIVTGHVGHSEATRAARVARRSGVPVTRR